MNIRSACCRERGWVSLSRNDRPRYGVLLAATLLLAGEIAAKQQCATSELLADLIDLDACRPAPIDPEEKARLLASLPAEGEITRLTKSERAKLGSLELVLSLHARDGVYNVKVVEVPEAAAGLHGRAVILISYPALRLLDAEELQAVVAHEVGHEYVWTEYATAQSRGETARLHELELACDAIAVLTLSRLGIRPDRLIAAMEKFLRFNEARFGPSDETRHPPLKARREVVERIRRWKTGEAVRHLFGMRGESGR